MPTYGHVPLDYGVYAREEDTNENVQGEAHSVSGCGTVLLEQCYGCQHPIEDRFLLRVMNRSWHERCLQCSVCRSPLSQSCFTKDRLLLCRHDYNRLYGARCNGCLQPIMSNDLVMKAVGSIYHARCFSCVECGHLLQKGDQFVPHDAQIYCRIDFEKKCAYLPLSPRSTDWFNMKSDDDSSLDDDGEHGKGPKRPRTILTTSQRRKFKCSFEVNPKPCRKVRETLAAETGLSVRVVQVWFQNQRAKMKKLARRQSEDGQQKSDKSKKNNSKINGKHAGKEDDTSESASSANPSDSGCSSLTALVTCSETKTSSASSIILDNESLPLNSSKCKDQSRSSAPPLMTEQHYSSTVGCQILGILSNNNNNNSKNSTFVTATHRLDALEELLLASHHHTLPSHQQSSLSGGGIGGLCGTGLVHSSLLNPIDKLYSMQSSYFSAE